MSGFAHHLLLGVLVMAIVSFVGVRVLTSSHALVVPLPPSHFSTPEDHAFANSENYATIDVGVPQFKHASKVDWYRGGKLIATTYTHTQATQANGYFEHFRYTWHISYATANSYHWVAKVHSPSGTSLAKNNQGKPYLDTLVIGNGALSDSKFLEPTNNAVWKSCDKSNFLRVEIRLQWNHYPGTSGDGDLNDVSMIKGVQFVNTSVNNPLHFEVTQHTYIHRGDDWFHTHRYVGYEYHPVGDKCLQKGPYDWIARVISPNGDGVHLAQEQSVPGVYVYHLELTVK